MKIENIRILASILLLSQLRVRGEKSGKQWWRRPKGLLVIDLVVFATAFAFVFIILNVVPQEYLIPVQLIAIQMLASVPIITLSFMILYGILFVIGESTQYSSSEMINYMPITATEYVLASSFSSVFMYSFLLSGILGISLDLAIKFGFVAIWIVSAILSIFFMIVGGFVGEIIRAIINRVSSSFSKRGGRSAIITRAILIIVILVASQLFFNPNILFRVLQSFAPQIYVLWFVPVMWPSIVVLDTYSGNYFSAGVFAGLSLAFGLSLMGIGVLLRSKYWVPLPVTIKLNNSKTVAYRKNGFYGKLGFTQAESAIIAKDTRSLFRRKEMVRYLALPLIILVPLLLTTGSLEYAETQYLTAGMTCLISSCMFGLFLSIISIAQEGQALWNLITAPLDTRSIFKAKIALSLVLSLIPAMIFPIIMTIIFNFKLIIAITLFSVTIILTLISVLAGSYIGPKYLDLEEKPRNNFVRGMGMFYAFVMVGIVGSVSISPLLLYTLFKQFALSFGFTLPIALILTILASTIFIAALYSLSSKSVNKLFLENPFE